MGAKLKKLTEKLKNIKGRLGKKSQMVIVLILSLVMLIIFFNGIKDGSKGEADSAKTETKTSLNGEDYVSSLELRLESLLESLSNVNSADVFIMTETSSRVVYAVDETKDESTSAGEKTEISSSTEIVFSKDGSISTPIVAVEIYPEIVGVLIVVDAEHDEKARLMIINAVAVALNINNSKIEVLTSKSA